MNSKSIRGCGKIFEAYKNFSDVDIKIKTREFLNNTLEEFARVSAKIYVSTEEMPFWHKERQLNSAFLPCFYNLGYGALQEFPTRRKPHGKDSTHGWLDYWVQKDKDCVFLIEVKHGWHYFEGNQLTKPNISKWKKSVSQLKDIKTKECNCLLNGMQGHKIALFVLPLWRNLKKSEDYREGAIFATSSDAVFDIAKGLASTIRPEPNWIGAWSLPEEMQYVFTNDKSPNTKKTIPGVIFVASLVK